MADEIDQTDERDMPLLEANVAAVRARAAAIPVGEPGECEHCGEYTPRIVRGACAPCRDKYNLG